MFANDLGTSLQHVQCLSVFDAVVLGMVSQVTIPNEHFPLRGNVFKEKELAESVLLELLFGVALLFGNLIVVDVECFDQLELTGAIRHSDRVLSHLSRVNNRH